MLIKEMDNTRAQLVSGKVFRGSMPRRTLGVDGLKLSFSEITCHFFCYFTLRLSSFCVRCETLGSAIHPLPKYLIWTIIGPCAEERQPVCYAKSACNTSSDFSSGKYGTCNR